MAALPLASGSVRRLWPDPADVDQLDQLVADDRRVRPDGRPWVLINMIASLDGAIALEGRSGGLGRPADKAMFSALRAVADVVLVGAGTARAERYGPARATPSQRAARAARGQAEAPPIAVVTRSLELDLRGALFSESRPLVITCEAAPVDRRQAVSEVADLVVVGDSTVDLVAAAAALADRGLRVVTCEGGPHLNGDLIAADLVEEWVCTFSPVLVAGTEGRASRRPGTAVPVAMRLDRLLEGDGLLLGRWLRDR